MKQLPLLAVLLAAPLAAPVRAGETATRTLIVRNDTSAAVNQLFVSGGPPGKLRAKVGGIFGTRDDDRDRLDARMLPRGGSIVVVVKGERCRYDLRAVLEDGRSYVADDYDICANGNWTIGTGARR